MRQDLINGKHWKPLRQGDNIFRSCRPLLPITYILRFYLSKGPQNGPLCTYLGLFWAILDLFGLFWASPVHRTGHYEPILDHFETILGLFGLLWVSPVQRKGYYEPILSHFETILGLFGLFWASRIFCHRPPYILLQNLSLCPTGHLASILTSVTTLPPTLSKPIDDRQDWYAWISLCESNGYTTKSKHKYIKPHS